ncbi:TrmH family RNA methyltransferase [Candidatus Wolfebacteria bacterium]|nr:TrmH family RNA methyltransferase [Candidatus Wolfebacteria bacterium]
MIVILHNIRSLHNVGSIFRTADAAGIEKIYLCGITPAPVDDFGKPRQQLTKVSLGAEKYVPWEHIKSTVKIINKLKKEKYKIFAIEQSKKSIPYYKANSKRQMANRKIALIVGNEISGLPRSVLKKSDKILEIPMRGAIVRQALHPRRTRRGKESLNVAVAFGIVVFHFRHN